MLDHRLRRIAAIAVAVLLSACAGSHFQPKTLTGQITTKEKSGDTVIRLRLLTEAGLGTAPALLGEQILNRPSHRPAPYALQYDGQAIQPDTSYELDVEVFAGGELKERATQPLTASQSGLPDTQNIATSPVGQ